MTRSSSDRPLGRARRWTLIGIGTTAAAGCIFGFLLAATPLVDSSPTPTAANAPADPVPCTTTVHGVVFGRSTLTANFIPAKFRLTSGNPADFGTAPVVYSSGKGTTNPPHVEIRLSDFKGALNEGVGGLSVPTKVHVGGHPALLENGASRDMPYVGVYWKQGSAHLLSVVGYKLSKSIVLQIAAHVHARLEGEIPLPLHPGSIVARGAAVSKARSWVAFHRGSAKAKLSSWTEVLNLLQSGQKETFSVPSTFDPTPWHPIWAVMVAHAGHLPQLVLIDAHSGGVAFSVGAGDGSRWFEALTDRDPTLHHGCAGGTSARLPFGIMTRSEEAYTLRDSGGSGAIHGVRVKNIIIMKLTTISAIHYIGCTKQDCGPYDLLWPRIEVSRAAPGKLIPCRVGWGPSLGRIVRTKMTKQYFSISAGSNSESGCGSLPRWVSRLRDLAPPVRRATPASSMRPGTLGAVRPPRSRYRKEMAAPIPCGTGESAIYFVAQMSLGGSVSQLQSDGFEVVALHAATAGAPEMVIVNPRKADGAPVSLKALTAEGGVYGRQGRSILRAPIRSCCLATIV